MLSRLERHVDTSDLTIDYVDLVNPRIRKNGQIGPSNFAIDDVVEVPSKLSDSGT